MIRNFEVTVYHHMVTVVEVEYSLKRIDWSLRTDGETWQYMVQKHTKSPIRNYFERATVEIQYHAKNTSKTGFILWDKRAKRQYNQSKKRREIVAKMEKLL